MTKTDASTNQTTLAVAQMTCASCVDAVERALAIAGVAAVEVRLASGEVAIRHAATLTEAALIGALARAGYHATARAPAAAAPAPEADESCACCAT